MVNVRQELLNQQFENKVVYTPDLSVQSYPILGGQPLELPSKFGGIWHKAKINVTLADGVITTEADTRDRQTYNPTVPYMLTRHIAGPNNLGVPVGQAKWYLVRSK